jgi:hypothetical protein
MINHQAGGQRTSPGTPNKIPLRSSPQVASPQPASKPSPKSSRYQATSPYVTLRRFTSATSEVFCEGKDSEGDFEEREEWIDRVKPLKRSSPLAKQRQEDEIVDDEIREFPSSVSRHFNNSKVSPQKGKVSMDELIGKTILTKSETISSDESEKLIQEPVSSPLIAMRKSLNTSSSLSLKIVKMSSLSPHTIQLLQKCVERGYMSVQCKDDFRPYDSDPTEVLITLVESQKTRQGVSLCKRTLTYLKVSDPCVASSSLRSRFVLVHIGLWML